MAQNTIQLKGAGLRKEAPAGGAITPGHLITRNSSNAFVVHDAAADPAVAMFALENELFGKEITQAYASGEQVLAWVPEKGGEVYALVAAGASAIVVGDYLESAGDGTLRKVTAFAQSGTSPFAVTAAGYPVARALKAVDNSGGSAPVRIEVEVL